MKQTSLKNYFKSQKKPLPNMRSAVHPELQAISPRMLQILLTQDTPQCLVIDARFDYEFNGGHIQSAFHFTGAWECWDFLTSLKPPVLPIVIHCEYSQKRGPKLYRWIRNRDMLLNLEEYPKLSFPELYLLEGGYMAFFKEYPNLCVPRGYTKMVKNTFRQLDKQYFKEYPTDFVKSPQAVIIKYASSP